MTNHRRSFQFVHPIFDRRQGKPILLPILAAGLMVIVYIHDAKAETVRGVTKDGKAYVCELKPPYPLLQFCVMFTKERG